MAAFVYNDLGLATAAAIHDGDPYTQGLAQAFADAFEALGGTVTGFTGVSKGTDMVPVLTEVAADSPEALFFPIFQPAGDFIADQALVLPVSRAPAPRRRRSPDRRLLDCLSPRASTSRS